MTGRTATLIGATGLIGGELLKLLEADEEYSSVRLLVRRPFSGERKRAEVKLIDFNDTESFKLGIEGSDTVFCAVGTTQKKVRGDKQAYRRVDFDIPVNAARFCRETGANQFMLVSSVGASSQSGNFYLKLKGEAEEAVRQQGPGGICFFRPSMLLGDRKEARPVEKAGQVLMTVFSFAFLGKYRKYKPVEASVVAAAMVAAAKMRKPGLYVYEYDSILKLARK